MIYFCVRVYNFPGDILYAVFETKYSQSGEHSFSFYLTLYKKKCGYKEVPKHQNMLIDPFCFVTHLVSLQFNFNLCPKEHYEKSE